MVKSLIWDSLERWQKVLLVILGIVVLPLTIILFVIYLLSVRGGDQTFSGAEKWHKDRQEEKTEEAKEKLEEGREETRKLIIRRKDRLEKIGRTNDDADKILSDIHNATSIDELDELRERIRSLR